MTAIIAIALIIIAIVTGFGSVRALAFHNDYHSRAAIPLMLALAAASAIALNAAANLS